MSEALRRLKPPGITIKAKKPIATDSLDHTHPLGTAQDNSTNPAFVRKLFDWIPATDVRLLDLGCAGGALSARCSRPAAWRSASRARTTRSSGSAAEWGTIPDYLFTADATEPFQLRNGRAMRFNVITGWEFFEHIPEDKLIGVADNIRRHATAGAIFVGSISRGVEPHHQTSRDKAWWIERLGDLGLHHGPAIEEHFGGDLVRGSADPQAVSFAFGAWVGTERPPVAGSPGLSRSR